MYISDCNPYNQYTIKCSASFVAESSNGYEEVAYSASIAGASVAIIAAALYARKRRMTRLAEDESVKGNFEMMSDGSVRA